MSSCPRASDGPAFHLSKLPKTSPISALDLERFLTRRLALDDEEQVQFAIRYDAHHLHCTNASTPILTILGILEDCNVSNILVQPHYYQVTEEDTPISTTTTACRSSTPRLWKRRHDWDDPKVPPPLTLQEISWIDLRQGYEWKTRAGLMDFFSTLLGDAHSSPWVHEPQNGIVTTDMVVLVVSKAIPLLEDYRVSDACPAWFFHAFAHFDELELNSMPTQQYASAPPATIYVYKRLAPRDRLLPDNPSSSEPTTPGCLWERLPPPEESPNDLPTIRQVCPPYLDLPQEYGIDKVESLYSPQALEIFTQEALYGIPQWTPWPETQHYSLGPNGETTTWTVFPLCYCFPANDASQLKWVDHTRQCCPKTCDLLQSIWGRQLRTALFSRLEPNTNLEAHTGWADLANHVLRLHIPLIVPTTTASDGKTVYSCGMWVDGCVEFHRVGHPLLFDDSKIHRAFNGHDTEARIVLIVDLERPASLPTGTATGGHSDELDQFIQHMSGPR